MTALKIFQMNPYIGDEEVQEIADSVKNNWVTEGPKAKQFIEQILKYTGAKYGVLANNGTIALYLALLVLGIKKGDEVIVTDFSFYASASVIHWIGATPVFVDITRDDFNIDVSKIEHKITPRTKAIMPVHIYGCSADMDPIIEIAKKYHLKIVEDACQSLGVFYKNRHTGTLGDLGCFSFFADKTITTAGEGGMVITNDEALYGKMSYLRNQGRLQSGTFIHPQFGVNFRLTDIAAGFGLAQLKKLEHIIETKLATYKLYKKLLGDLDEVEFLTTKPYTNFVPFRVNIKVKNLAQLLNHMEVHGVQTRGCFYPLHKQKIFEYLNYEDKDFPNAIFANENAMSLPVHLGMDDEKIKYVCRVIKDFYKKQ